MSGFPQHREKLSAVQAETRWTSRVSPWNCVGRLGQPPPHPSCTPSPPLLSADIANASATPWPIMLKQSGKQWGPLSSDRGVSARHLAAACSGQGSGFQGASPQVDASQRHPDSGVSKLLSVSLLSLSTQEKSEEGTSLWPALGASSLKKLCRAMKESIDKEGSAECFDTKFIRALCSVLDGLVPLMDTEVLLVQPLCLERGSGRRSEMSDYWPDPYRAAWEKLENRHTRCKNKKQERVQKAW